MRARTGKFPDANGYLTIPDERGHTYGRLTVREYVGSIAGQGAIWLCQCECGKQTKVAGRKLRAGGTVSCGCYRADPELRQGARMKVSARRRKQIAAMGGAARRDKRGE